jgi:hypothetical protein
MASDTRDFRNPILSTPGAPAEASTPATAPPATVPTAPVEGRPAGFASGGSLFYAACGLATIVLAVIGLIGYWHSYAWQLASIASIVLGVGLAIESWLIGVRSSVFSPALRGVESVAGGEGTGAEFAGGVAGIVLGIMALLNWSSLTLIAVAAIVLGVAMLLGGGSAARLHWMATERSFAGHELHRPLVRDLITSATSGQMFVGCAALVLGIIAVVMDGTMSMESLVVSLVAYLCLGCAALFTGATIFSKMSHQARR